jgi:ABC-type lipoprotein release transport system permease subunit
MIDISYIMGFIGVAVGLIIGILIYSEVEQAIDCPNAAAGESQDGQEACERAKQIAWTVISILPISMFFALFAIFGGFSRAVA